MRTRILSLVSLFLLLGGVAWAVDPWSGCDFLTAGTGVTITCPNTTTGGATITSTGGISGGTTNTIVKFTSATTIGNSAATDDGSTFQYTSDNYGLQQVGPTTTVSTYIAGSGGYIGTTTNSIFCIFTNDSSCQTTFAVDSSVDFTEQDGQDYALLTAGGGQAPIRLFNTGTFYGWQHAGFDDVVLSTRIIQASQGGGIGTLTDHAVCLFVNDGDCRAGVTATTENFVVTSGSNVNNSDVTASIFTVDTHFQGAIPAPKMTTTQRDDVLFPVGTPIEGLAVFNTTTHLPNWYNGSAWIALVSSLVGTSNQITANASTGAITLSLPSAVTLPGSLTVTTRTGTPAKAATFDSGGVLGETTGISATATVRDAAGTGTCTLIFTVGIRTGGTC